MKTTEVRTNSQAFPNVAAFRAAFLATAQRDSAFYMGVARVGFRPGNGMVVLETVGGDDIELTRSGFATIGEPSYGDADYLDAVQKLPDNRCVITSETPTFSNWGGRRAMVSTIMEALGEKTDRMTLACGGKGGQYTWIMRPDGNMIGLTLRGWSDVAVIPEVMGGGLLAVATKGGGIYKLEAASIASDNYDAWYKVKIMGEGTITGLDMRFMGSMLTARCQDGRLAVLECVNIENNQIRIVDRTSDAIQAHPRGRVMVENRPFGLFSVTVAGKHRTVIGPTTDMGLPHASITTLAS